MSAISSVLPKIQNQVLEVVQDHILRDTYGASRRGESVNKLYADGSGKPTYEFLDSFLWAKTKKTINGMVANLYHDYTKMINRSPSSSYPYGTHTDSGMDYNFRQGIADALNNSGYIYGKNREPFWDNAINEINDNIYKWIDKELRPLGFTRGK